MVGAHLPAAPAVGAVEEPLADVGVDVEREVLRRRPLGEEKAVAEDALLVLAPVRGAGEDGDATEHVEDGRLERALHAGAVVLGDELADPVEAGRLFVGDVADDVERVRAGRVVDDAGLVGVLQRLLSVGARWDEG